MTKTINACSELFPAVTAPSRRRAGIVRSMRMNKDNGFFKYWSAPVDIRRQRCAQAVSGTAVSQHMQKSWIISAKLNDLLALAQRFERHDGAKLALDRRSARPDSAK